MLKTTYEKKHPHCHRCGFNKKKSSNTWFKKGRVPWHKGTKGLIKSWSKGTKGILKPNKTSFKKGDIRISGPNNNHWKGEEVGYYALHYWIYRNWGNPIKCEICGRTTKLEWASKTFLYTRNKKDWWTLCVWCHRKYDYYNSGGKAVKKFNLYK